MGITLPIPGTTLPFGTAPAGESWGEFYNTGLSTIDQHDHTSGKGLRITPAAISIDAELDFNSEDLIGLRSTRFEAISLGDLGVSDIGALLVSGADLYYVDTAGNQVRMTSGGAVAGAPGSISGLAAPASASYASVPKLFSFDSGVDTVGGVACGPLVLTDSTVPNGFATTIQVPAGLAADYQLTLPGALPGHTQLATFSSAGVMAFSDVVDNSTLQLSSGVMSIKALGVDTAQLAANGVTRAKMAAVGQQVSSSSGSFTDSSNAFVDVTNLTVTITTTGRPVMLMLQTVSGSAGGIASTTPSTTCAWHILRGATVVGAGTTPTSATQQVSTSFAAYLDVIGSGTYTYKVQAINGGGASTVSVSNMVLAAYEL